MGRITIFAINECPFCKRAKGALTQRNIPYTEISLSTHPSKRSDMLSLADQLTVPQIFFNEQHIGGATDLLALLETWDKENENASESDKRSPLERYKTEIESKADPVDPRLQPSSEPPVVETPPLPRTNEMIELPNGESASYLEVYRMLSTVLPRKNKSYHGTLYNNCFKGDTGVTAIMKHYNLTERKQASDFLFKLQDEHQMLGHVLREHSFEDSDRLYYRLQQYFEPKVLNNIRVWTDRVVDLSDAIGLVKRLKKMFGKLESKYTDENGDVDYIAVYEDASFLEFEEATCELQQIDMSKMDEATRLAFGINLYNLMIKHAFTSVGIPSSTLTRGSFFNNVSYCIGGYILSFSELENGILRANAKAPYALSHPFSSSDNRLHLALKEVDPRIHFALNCGAKSCPPIKSFTAEGIQEELRIVAQSFNESDDSTLVDEEKHELRLSMILSWYMSDFAPSKSELASKVVEFLRGEKKEKLLRMIASGKSISVKFNEYDWSTNALKSKKFDGVLKTEENSALAFVKKAVSQKSLVPAF